LNASPNEFSLSASHFDDLDDAGRDCKIALTDKATVVWCKSGYIGMTNTVNYVNAYSNERAALTYTESGWPRSVEVSKFISVVDPKGEYMAVTRTDNFYPLRLELENE
jgi:hypothetical protein